jgi:hypothetical protein
MIKKLAFNNASFFLFKILYKHMAKLMGLGTLSDATFKRKFRWLFSINGIIGDRVNAL